MTGSAFDQKKSIVEFLVHLASQQRLIERAIEGCNAWFENEADGLIDGWSSQDLIKEFFSHSLKFKHSDWDLVYIDTK